MPERDDDRDREFREREFRERGDSGRADNPERGPDRGSSDAPERDHDRADRGTSDTDLGFRRPDFTERELGLDPGRSGEADAPRDATRDVDRPR
jgi:hypothetical protein